MDQLINEYLEKMVSEASNYIRSGADQEEIKDKIRSYLDKVVVETLIDSLSDYQLLQIKDLDYQDKEMREKLTQFASEIPGFIFDAEKKLKDEVEKIKQTGQIPTL